MSDFYRLEGHVPVRCADVQEWARWFDGHNRHVAFDQIGPLRVSTVFLGSDHQYGSGPPLLFETMIFGTGDGEYQERCSTWAEAEAMHDRGMRAALAMLERASAFGIPAQLIRPNRESSMKG